MALRPDAGSTRPTARSVDLSWDNPDLDKEPREARDWKKLFLVAGLGTLSWVATYVGMLELIEANMGELPLVHKLIIGFSVAMLMVMVVWLLDQMFSDVGWVARSLYGAGYVFLTVISVGFGFGFYWKVLESRSEASRSAESAVGQVQTSLHAAMTRLEQLQGTLDGLTRISTQKADTERQTGASCPNSKPGDGPRRKMRDDDAGRFKFAADFVQGRIGTVRSDIAALEADLGRILKDDKSTVDQRSGTRNEFMRGLGRKLEFTVAGFNAFRTDPQLKQIRADLNERADKVTFIDTKGGTYTCPDSQLTTALKGVVRAIDELPVLEKPRIAAVEGSEAVIEAFRRLTATFYGALAFKMPPSPEELRELQKKAVQSVENAGQAQAKLSAMAEQAGLSKRDYVPLAIAIFVDLCLLLVSMRKSGNRLQGLVPKMRAAERGPVIQILSRFNEIHRDKQIRENFEVFRHVVFDFHGDYYAAVPLNAPYRPNPRNGEQRQGYGVSDAHELLQEAHLLGNLFASFEKEKIFTRVYSPLLSTKTVQKRLRRQGSKFAGSEAFRIYRFRDGAWSEIILGAVMGAARRVEADKRRRRMEEDAFAAAEGPTLDSRPRPAGHGGRDDGDDGLRTSGEAAVAFGGRRGEQPAAFPYVVAGRDHVDPAAARDGPGRGADWPPRTVSALDPQVWAHPAAEARPGDTPAGDASRFSMARRPTPWPGPTEASHGDAPPEPRRPANNNTAPATLDRADPLQQSLQNGKRPPENIVLHPAVARPAPQADAGGPGAIDGALAIAASLAEPTVTVAATRETVTYTVPVSEASLPRSLFGALDHGAAALAAPATDETAAEAKLTALPPPLPDVHAAPPSPAADTGDAGDDDRPAPLSDDPRTIALRLRPERHGG